ncbi:MAG TPA: DNA-processing protein DprA [Chitinophagaceae bacterium]
MNNFAYQKLFDTFTDFEKKYAPQNLFVAGDASLLYSGLKVSIVGSRKPSQKGIEDAQCLAKTLVSHGAVVLSGLAEGIDTVAHETAIKNGGKTIAVLGTPLDVAYPAKNRGLLETIKRDHLAISQFPIGYPTKKENFPMRNRTMALLSDATIIVEASEVSGTRHQGWEALRLGRFIFIMKSVLENKELSWPKEMVKYGAQELTCELLPSFMEFIPNITARLEYA